MIKFQKIFLIILIAGLSNQQNCSPNQFLFRDTCLDQCPQNTIKRWLSSTNYCQECDMTRFLVLSSDKSNCICARQTYLQLTNNQCLPCHYSCTTCTGSARQNCQLCKDGLDQNFRYKQGNQCLCLPGYYDDKVLQSNKCIACHLDCRTCSGSSQNQCVQCSFGRVKNQFGLCACPSGFSVDGNGNCFCPFTIMPDGQCKSMVNKCGFNQQPGVRAATTGVQGLTCSCLKGLQKIKGICGTCNTNQTLNPKTGKCQCSQGTISHKNKCLKCPTTQIFNKKTGQCDCKKNQHKTSTGSCIKCPNKSYYSDEKGKCVCIFNYFQDTTGKCKKCSKKGDNPLCTDKTHNLDSVRKLELIQVVRNTNNSVSPIIGRVFSPIQNFNNIIQPPTNINSSVPTVINFGNNSASNSSLPIFLP